MDIFLLLYFSFGNGILLLLFMTNLCSDHCTYVDFNTVSVLWRPIKKTIIRQFIYFSQKKSCLSIGVEGCFLYFIGKMVCIVSAPYLVKIICHVYFS